MPQVDSQTPPARPQRPSEAMLPASQTGSIRLLPLRAARCPPVVSLTKAQTACETTRHSALYACLKYTKIYYSCLIFCQPTYLLSRQHSNPPLGFWGFGAHTFNFQRNVSAKNTLRKLLIMPDCNAILCYVWHVSFGRRFKR